MFDYNVDNDISLKFMFLKDSHELFNFFEKERKRFQKYLLIINKLKNEDDVKEFIKDNLKKYIDNEGIPNFLSITHKNKIIGIIGFWNFNGRAKSVELGYAISMEYEGKGYVTLCLKKIIDILFTKMDINKIIIRTSTKNPKSYAIPERLKFIKEGILRQEEYVNNEFIDLNVYSLL